MAEVTIFLKIHFPEFIFVAQIIFVTGVPAIGWAEMIPADLIRIMPAKGGSTITSPLFHALFLAGIND